MQKTAKIDTILIKSLITEEKCETKKMPKNTFKCSKKKFFSKKNHFWVKKMQKTAKIDTILIKCLIITGFWHFFLQNCFFFKLNFFLTF